MRRNSTWARTAPYYARYRAGYARELYEHLTNRFSLDGTQRVLDLVPELGFSPYR